MSRYLSGLGIPQRNEPIRDLLGVVGTARTITNTVYIFENMGTGWEDG